MSPVKNADPKLWLQELKTNRKVQVGLGVLAVSVWLLWPDAPKATARTSNHAAIIPLGDRQAQDLQKLPDLARLDRAGELPPDDHLYRDLFLFEGPPPPPPPPPKPLPPPPPPTAEQLAAQALAAARAQEANSKPQNLRYLGFISSERAGRLGAFMKGEEPVSIRQGDLANPKWRLVKLTDVSAEFQNLKFPDLRQRLDAADLAGAHATAPTNQF
jgi:hypothetical protein